MSLDHPEAVLNADMSTLNLVSETSYFPPFHAAQPLF